VNIVVYETSIYEHENINDYFVQEILNILPKGKQIQDNLKNFMTTVEASAVMLIDENRLTIAEAFADKPSRDICRICGPQLALIIDNLRKADFFAPEKIEIEMQGWLFLKQFEYSNMKFYLIFFMEAHESFVMTEEFIPSFQKELHEIMEYIL
jgi:hypothetical protein